MKFDVQNVIILLKNTSAYRSPTFKIESRYCPPLEKIIAYIINNFKC